MVQPTGGGHPFDTCLAAGCLVPLAFDATAMATPRSASELAIMANTHGSEERVQLPVSLAGFSAAFDRVAALTGRN